MNSRKLTVEQRKRKRRQDKKYYQNNKERVLERNKQWRIENEEYIRQWHTKYMKEKRNEPRFKEHYLGLQRNRRNSNKEKTAYFNAKKTLVARIEIIQAYSLGRCCACCKEDNIFLLSVDHIDGKRLKEEIEHEKKYGVKMAGLSLYMLLKKKGFPKGYQILCYNCNLSKGHHGMCPHQGFTKKFQKLIKELNLNV